jgi:hypothetical protein
MLDVTDKVVTKTTDPVNVETIELVKNNSESKQQTSKTEPARYKLNLYTDSGTVRPIFSGAVIRDVSRKYGDIIRAFSSTRFMTEDEVCESVWTIEKKMRYPINRTRKQVQEEIQQLIDRQIIVTD